MLPQHLLRPMLRALWVVPGAANSLYGQNQPKVAQSMTDSLAYLQLTEKQRQDVMGLNIAAAGALGKLKQKARADITLKGTRLFNRMLGIMQARNRGLWAILLPDQQRLFSERVAGQMAALETMKQKMQKRKS